MRSHGIWLISAHQSSLDNSKQCFEIQQKEYFIKLIHFQNNHGQPSQARQFLQNVNIVFTLLFRFFIRYNGKIYLLIYNNMQIFND